MATDMDIEMDLDIGFPEEDPISQEIEILPDAVVVGSKDPIL
jgi:hypothetical protein